MEEISKKLAKMEAGSSQRENVFLKLADIVKYLTATMSRMSLDEME
jgi:hypothetical protein